MYKTIQSTIDDARDESKGNADVVIGVGHLGINESSEFNQSTEVLKHVNGFDAFIDGHSHHATLHPEGYSATVPYVQTGTAFANIGKVEISKDAKGNYSLETSLISNFKDELTTKFAKDAQSIVDD